MVHAFFLVSAQACCYLAHAVQDLHAAGSCRLLHDTTASCAAGHCQKQQLPALGRPAIPGLILSPNTAPSTALQLQLLLRASCFCFWRPNPLPLHLLAGAWPGAGAVGRPALATWPAAVHGAAAAGGALPAAHHHGAAPAPPDAPHAHLPAVALVLCVRILMHCVQLLRHTSHAMVTCAVLVCATTASLQPSCPPPAHRCLLVKQVCHQCLSTRVTPRRQSAADTLPHFCSWECHAAALATYFRVESRLHLGGLAAYCKKQEEKMPLMAARLACGLVQEAMHQATHQELHQARAAWPAQLQQRAAAARFPGTQLGGAEPAPGSSSSRPGASSEVSSSSSDEEGEGAAGEVPLQGGAPVKPYQSWSRAGEQAVGAALWLLDMRGMPGMCSVTRAPISAAGHSTN